MDTCQNQILKVIFGAVIVLGFILGYFIYTLLKQQKKIAAWQEARIKAEIETLENERKRIASDLHDDIGPMLSAIKLQVNHVEPAIEEEKKIIEKSGKLMDEVIGRFREIAYDLLPNTLIRKGLVTALSEFIGKMNEAHDLQIHFIHDDDIPLSPVSELNLYRIAQEIIHNAIKHAQASELIIQLNRINNELVFTAADNGKGFNYNGANALPTAGLGLLNIQNRVILLNAKLTIKSEQLTGTYYHVLIPLEKNG